MFWGAEPQPKKNFTTEATEITEHRRGQELWVNKLSNRRLGPRFFVPASARRFG